MVGYVETKTRASVSFSVSRFTVGMPGTCRLKALVAWLTSACRSARNSTRLTQLARISRSASAMTVRVLPAPVAMTSSAARRCCCSKASADPADRPDLVVAARRSPH